MKWRGALRGAGDRGVARRAAVGGAVDARCGDEGVVDREGVHPRRSRRRRARGRSAGPMSSWVRRSGCRVAGARDPGAGGDQAAPDRLLDDDRLLAARVRGADGRGLRACMSIRRRTCWWSRSMRRPGFRPRRRSSPTSRRRRASPPAASTSTPETARSACSPRSRCITGTCSRWRPRPATAGT